MGNIAKNIILIPFYLVQYFTIVKYDIKTK
jgi:hypothetical protein